MPDNDDQKEEETTPPPQDIGRSALTSTDIDDVLNEDGTVKVP